MKNNSVAIVTGASQGIGRATAVRLARDFSAVVLAARNQDELQKTAAAVSSAGAEPQIYALDLREPQAAEARRQRHSRSFRQNRCPAQHCRRSATD